MKIHSFFFKIISNRHIFIKQIVFDLFLFTKSVFCVYNLVVKTKIINYIIIFFIKEFIN